LRSTQGEINFKNTIREVISLGGDTDTNAAIVGGMIGALVGFSKIDEGMIKKLLMCDSSKEGKHLRPEWLVPG